MASSIALARGSRSSVSPLSRRGEARTFPASLSLASSRRSSTVCKTPSSPSFRLPVQGLGTIGGFKLQVENRADLGYVALDTAMKRAMAKAAKAPELAGVFSSYQINTPQLFADLDRTKAEQLGVSVQDVFDTMQIYLGSIYINDFNKFGRTYEVIAQADQ